MCSKVSARFPAPRNSPGIIGVTPEAILKLPYRPCVGVALVNRDGLIFTGQRIDSAGDAWQMPQGGIDPGEEPQSAALRELTEETGISPDLVSVEHVSPSWHHYDLPHDLIPKLWKGRFRGQKQKWFLMRFAGTDTDIEIQTAHPEFSAWRWATPDQVVRDIVPFKRALYRDVIGAFAPYL